MNNKMYLSAVIEKLARIIRSNEKETRRFERSKVQRNRRIRRRVARLRTCSYQWSGEDLWSKGQDSHVFGLKLQGMPEIAQVEVKSSKIAIFKRIFSRVACCKRLKYLARLYEIWRGKEILKGFSLFFSIIISLLLISGIIHVMQQYY